MEYSLFEFVPEGAVTKKTVYAYVGGGLSERLTYGPDKSLQDKTVYTRDAEGRVLERITYRGNGERIESESIAYGSNSEFVKEYFGSDSVLASRYESDRNGNVVLEVHYGMSGAVTSKEVYEYTYNDNEKVTLQLRYKVI
jgi:hypothetical protein